MKSKFYSIFLLSALMLLPAISWGSVFNVSVANDSGPGTLRDAVADAGIGDTVIFLPNLAGIPVVLSSGPIVIDKDLTIVGLSSAVSAISANNTSRVISIQSGHNVFLRGLTFALGLANGAGDAGRGGGIFNQGNLTMLDVKVLGGRASLQGGGIYSTGNISAAKAVIKSCEAPEGAGVYIQSGNMTLNESKLEDNLGSIGAGLYFNGSNGSMNNSVVNRNIATGNGGGFYVQDAVNLSLSKLSIQQNQSGGSGGSIYINDGLVQFNRTLHVLNTATLDGGAVYIGAAAELQSENMTYSANTADGRGGGIYASGRFLARANTYTENIAGVEGGAIYLDPNVRLRLIDGSIVSGNTAPVQPEVAFPSRFFTSEYNLYGSIDDLDFVPGTGDLIGAPALLEALADNGGASGTHALQCGSAALDAGNPSSPVAVDQRNLPRGVNGRSDIGAYERQEICVEPCAIDSVQIGAQGLCDEVSNTYTQELTIYTSNAPLSGQIIVNGQSFALSASPQTVVLSALPSNGLAVNLDIVYSEDSLCVFSQPIAWTAAADCYSCTAQTPQNTQATLLEPSLAMALTWDPIPGTVACRVSGRPLGAPNFALVVRTGPAISQINIPASSLNNGVSYEWRVACACAFPPSSSDLTNVSVLDTFLYNNGEPLCDAASIPEDLQSTFQPADSTMLLTWGPPAGMINCRINIRPVGAPVFSLLSVDGTPPTSYVLPQSSLVPGTTYEWRLRCSCTVPPGPGEQTDFSALVNFTYPLLRLGETEGSLDPKLYPNPVQSAFYAEWNAISAGPFEALVYAADGRLIESRTGESPAQSPVQLSFDASTWAPGPYTIMINNADGSSSHRLIKLD